MAELCISVKLKNLKANHNVMLLVPDAMSVVYIRKVKKSESKSQHLRSIFDLHNVVYIRKVKKSESKSQLRSIVRINIESCVYP